ncbi:MAG: FapA family protein [Clostridia bacterium]
MGLLNLFNKKHGEHETEQEIVAETPEVLEEVFIETLDISSNVTKLVGMLPARYDPYFVFEKEDNQYELSVNKIDERKKMLNWLNSTCGTYANSISIQLMKHNKAVNDETKAALAENRAVVDIPYAPTDAKIFVYTSTDKVVAWVLLVPPIGDGQHVTVKDVMDILKLSKVTHYIDEKYIEKMVNEQMYFHTYPIAIAKAPKNGENGYIVDYYPREAAEFIATASETVDYKLTDFFRPVFEGYPIAEIHMPTDGEDGIALDGEIIFAKPGNGAKIPMGTNTEVSEDGTMLISKIDGDVTFSKGAFSVRNTINIPGDVDYSTGNINFMGDVHIKGNVRDNFIVRATGSVTVGGVLEAGTIDAEGDVVITGGVLGNKDGTIRCRGNVKAKFMESCKVYTGGSLVTDYIVHSEIYADGPIVVTSGKATIIGGSISAHGYIEAKILGRQDAPRRSTMLNLGVDPCHGGNEVSTLGTMEEGEDFIIDTEEVEGLGSLLDEFIDGDEQFSEEIDEDLIASRGKFVTIHSGVCIKYNNDVVDIVNTTAGAVRFNKLQNKIVVGGL